MTTFTDIANRALQVPGTRTTVTALELANNSTNEAIQINLAYNAVRKRLIRMAPWNCVLKTANLVYITSLPGTPENSARPLWVSLGSQVSPRRLGFMNINIRLIVCMLLGFRRLIKSALVLASPQVRRLSLQFRPILFGRLLGWRLLLAALAMP